MQPDLAKVARLTGRVPVIEKKSDAVGGVVTLGLDLFMREKRNIGIGIAKNRNQILAQGAGQAAAVALLEFIGVGEPSYRVA